MSNHFFIHQWINNYSRKWNFHFWKLRYKAFHNEKYTIKLGTMQTKRQFLLKALKKHTTPACFSERLWLGVRWYCAHKNVSQFWNPTGHNQLTFVGELPEIKIKINQSKISFSFISQKFEISISFCTMFCIFHKNERRSCKRFFAKNLMYLVKTWISSYLIIDLIFACVINAVIT